MRKPVMAAIALCLAFVTLGLTPPLPSPAAGAHVSAPQAQPMNAARMPAAQTDGGGGSIRLWRDAADDLWIATPFYTWNITGGASITIISGGQAYEWFGENSAAGYRLVDDLFLSPQTGAPIASRIIFALPEEALVYLERQTDSGGEGLEIAFRASDALIRLTHRILGISTQESKPASQLALTLAKSKLSESTSSLPANKARAAESYSYYTRFDSVSHEGYAWLQPPQVIASLAQAQPAPCPKWPSASTPSAYDPCQFPNFFLPGQALDRRYLYFYSADPATPIQPIETLVAALGLTLPDLDAAYIARTPPYDYDASKNQPAAGEAVAFQARVANRGGEATGPFTYQWFIDDALSSQATYPNLAPGQMITLTLNWAWQTGTHKVRIKLDPDNAITEVEKQNNQVEDQTNALAVGFWVEQSVYDYFNTHQVELGLGSVSWDDWAQRQLRVWNQMFAGSVHPLTPQGIIDRVRLDKVVVTPDGALPNPYPSNWPDMNDKTIDLEWGFPSELVGVPSGHTSYSSFYPEHPEVQNVEYSLMHELSHARYLIDLYGLDVGFGVLHLSTDVDSSTSTLSGTQSVENDSGFPLPSYLAVEGELVVCQSKSGSAFTECSRGAEGTTPRSHPSNALVNVAIVRLQDGSGNLIQGSPAMPLIGGGDDHVYYNRYPSDVMSGGVTYEQHSAFALNRIAGHRAVCGNYNAPCNIGEYLRDLPQHFVVEVRGGDGRPLPGAQVEVHSSKSFSASYAKLFLNSPDATSVTNAQGQVDLGQSPFGEGAPTGPGNALLLLKVSYGTQTVYRFIEATDANEAYWSGQDTVIYIIALGLEITKGAPATAVPGELITYTIAVNNKGDTLATNLVITDAIPNGATYISGGTRVGNTVSWAVPSLAAGASASAQFVVTATHTITNSDYRVMADGNKASYGPIPVVTVIGPRLQISKSGPEMVLPGAPITFTLTTTNTGSTPATNVVIFDTVPSGATYISGGTPSGQVVTWAVPGGLAPGVSKSVQLIVTSTQTIANNDYGVMWEGGGLTRGAVSVVVTPTDPPTCAITSPSTGAIVSDIANVTIIGKGDRVDLYLDGVLHGRTSSLPADGSWSTRQATNGPHTLQAVTYDSSGRTARSPIVAVTVSNPPATALWFQVGLSGLTTQDLAVAPTNRQVVYAATEENGVYKTLDRGMFWMGISKGLPADVRLSTLAISPADSQVVYIGGSNGIYKTTDGGDSWLSTGLGTAVNDLAIARSSQQTLYAVGGGGAYRTLNGGITWTSVLPHVALASVAIDPADPQTTYVGMYDYSGYMYKSTDGGDSWVTRTVESLSGQIATIAIDPSETQTLYVGKVWGGVGLYRSVNGALTWVDNLFQYSLQSLAIAPSDRSFVYGSGQWNGVYQFQDGGTAWTDITAGLPDKAVRTLAVDLVNPRIIYAGLGEEGIWKRTVFLSAFDKATPADAATGVAANPTLSWDTGGEASGYEYCYDTTNDNACSGTWVSAGTDGSVTLGGLSASTTYYWQVRAANSGETIYANTGSWWSFTTAAPPVWHIYLPVLMKK